MDPISGLWLPLYSWLVNSGLAAADDMSDMSDLSDAAGRCVWNDGFPIIPSQLLYSRAEFKVPSPW